MSNDYISTRATSTHVCWIINKFEESMLKKINIPIDFLFSFTKIFSLNFFLKNSTNNLSSVKDAKIL